MDMVFPILGFNYCVESTREHYNEYRQRFVGFADQAKNEFCQWYGKQSSMEYILGNFAQQVRICYQPALDFCMDTLASHRILNIEEDAFCEKDPSVTDSLNGAFDSVYDRYAEITMTEEELRQYRSARKAGRSRWSGGGFGLSGAVKGAMTAGALNLASGAVHAAVNGIGNVASSISAGVKKDRLRKDPKTCETLAQGVWAFVFGLHIVLAMHLYDANADKAFLNGRVNEDAKINAAAILSNVHRVTNVVEKKEALLQSLALDPYQLEWYLFVLDNFGDEDGSLTALANHFGITCLEEQKEVLISYFAESHPIDTEANALKAQSEMQAYCRSIHFDGETDEIRKINKAVSDFDLAYRTVDGCVCKTRTEADDARSELPYIQEIISRTDDEDLSSLASARASLSDYHTVVAEKYKNNLKKQWELVEQNTRTVDTLIEGSSSIIYDSIEDAEQARAIARDYRLRLDQCGDTPESEDALLQFKADLEKTPKAKIVTAYSDAVEMRLSCIDREKRTAFGKEYSTREQAQSARDGYHQIEQEIKSTEAKARADTIREKIQQIDLPDQVKAELKNSLFLTENEKEIKTAKKLSSITSIIWLALILCAIFIGTICLPETAMKSIVLLDGELVMEPHTVSDSLGYIDGLRNGALVFGEAIVKLFVHSFNEYIHGFYHGLVGNILWAILGIMWVFIKWTFFAFLQYFVTLAVFFFQKATLGYYVGYIISALIPFGVSKFSFDEDHLEEGVAQVKEMRPKKVAKWIAIVILVVIVSIAFILIERSTPHFV